MSGFAAVFKSVKTKAVAMQRKPVIGVVDWNRFALQHKEARKPHHDMGWNIHTTGDGLKDPKPWIGTSWQVQVPMLKYMEGPITLQQ